MNVQEVIQLKNKRKVKNKDAIEKIMSNIHKRIRHYAQLKRESCEYTIPAIIDAMPLFNITEITKEVFKNLDKEGFIVNAYSDGTLNVCWNEDLVKQKVDNDAYVLSQEEKILKNITHRKKNVDKRFDFLANHKKMKELSLEDQLDSQLQKILKEKKKNNTV